MELIPQLNIRDLMLFKVPSMYKKTVEESIENAKQKGVNIGDLKLNSFIYQYGDLSLTIAYIKTLEIMIEVFSDVYYRELYELKSENLIYPDDIPNAFMVIFDAINNQFNEIIDDGYLYEEFIIYGSEISLEAILMLYDVFNEYFVNTLKPYTDTSTITHLIISRVKYIPIIYDMIFEKLEDVYLPFY